MSYRLSPELELKQAAELLAALRKVKDPWNPGSAVSKLIARLADHVENLAAEVMKNG